MTATYASVVNPYSTAPVTYAPANGMSLGGHSLGTTPVVGAGAGANPYAAGSAAYALTSSSVSGASNGALTKAETKKRKREK
jgi:hypothetical protein